MNGEIITKIDGEINVRVWIPSKSKISLECNDIELEDEEGKCQCFDNAMFRIETFKTQEYEMVTPEGTVSKKCFDAFKDAAPKVTKQYRACILALQCKYRY